MADRDTIFYRWSLDEARHIGEVPKWRESHVANLECKQAIEEAINRDYNDNHLDANCAKSIIDKFGFDRTNFILKCTVRMASQDGRYSDDNKAWSRISRMADSNFRGQYALTAHPAIINAFINQARREWENLGLFDNSHIDKSEEAMDFENKVCVLRPDSLRDEFKTPQDQLFLATSGFGCDPTKIGRSVSGYFLADGEFATFQRTDFYGVIDDQYLPEWASEKVNEILGDQSDSQTDSMEMS